jgi:alkylation response protein AidB-like acyl-CoA dehydrogenase
MDRALVEKVCDDWYMLVCSGLGPPNGPYPGRNARRQGDGWVLNYQGSFASGCHNATWNFVMSGPVVNEETGEPAEQSFMVPRGEFEIIDTWDTAGMRGSGSHDVRMANVYVPPEHLLPARALGPSDTWDEPTFRNPTHATYNKSAVALGVCKGALDSFIELAQEKTPWGLSVMLKDQPTVQYRLGELMATYLAVRTFALDTQDRLEANLGRLSQGGKRAPDWDVLRPANIACTLAAQTCRDIVGKLNNTAGTTGSRMDHPLERKLRDAQQAATHALISYRHFENLGKTWMGHEPPEAYLALQRA